MPDNEKSSAPHENNNNDLNPFEEALRDDSENHKKRFIDELKREAEERKKRQKEEKEAKE